MRKVIDRSKRAADPFLDTKVQNIFEASVYELLNRMDKVANALDAADNDQETAPEASEAEAQSHAPMTNLAWVAGA